MLAPHLLAGTGLSALTAGALGAGVGGAIQEGSLEKGLLTGLTSFAGGSLLGGLMGSGADAAASGGAGFIDQNIVGAPAAAPVGFVDQNITGLAPAAAAAPAGIKGIMGGAMDFAKTGTGMGIGAGAAIAPALTGLFDKGDKKPKRGGNGENQPIPRMASMPTIGTGPGQYQPGAGPEWDYGVSMPQSAAGIQDYTRNRPLYAANGGMISRFANPTMPGLGPVRLAGGGIVALAEGGAVPEGGQQQGPNEHEIAMAAEQVIRSGDTESREGAIILAAYVKLFGEEALIELASKVESGAMTESTDALNNGEGGKVVGPGDTTADMIPTMLSADEFVVNAEATQAIGPGKLEEINNAGPRAAEVAKRRMATA